MDKMHKAPDSVQKGSHATKACAILLTDLITWENEQTEKQEAEELISTKLQQVSKHNASSI